MENDTTSVSVLYFAGMFEGLDEYIYFCQLLN